MVGCLPHAPYITAVVAALDEGGCGPNGRWVDNSETRAGVGR